MRGHFGFANSDNFIMLTIFWADCRFADILGMCARIYFGWARLVKKGIFTCSWARCCYWCCSSWSMDWGRSLLFSKLMFSGDCKTLNMFMLLSCWTFKSMFAGGVRLWLSPFSLVFSFLVGVAKSNETACWLFVTMGVLFSDTGWFRPYMYLSYIIFLLLLNIFGLSWSSFGWSCSWLASFFSSKSEFFILSSTANFTTFLGAAGSSLVLR